MSLHQQLTKSLFVIALLVQSGAVRAQERAAFAMSIREFSGLSVSDQKALLATVFEYRLRHAQNISYEAEIRIGIHEYVDSRVGKCNERCNGANFRGWRMGPAYRMQIDSGGPEPSTKDPDGRVFSAYNSRKGEVRSTTRIDDRIFGRLDTEHNGLMERNRFEYWLDGEDTAGDGDHLIRYLVERQGQFEVETPYESSLVRLTMPWSAFEGQIGKREFVVDPQRGFLPIRGKREWGKPNDEKTGWKMLAFSVQSSQLVGDVFMPTQFTEVVGCQPVRGGKLILDSSVNVWETRVTKIEAGRVTQKELAVEFPEGTEVVDAIRGEAYKVGKDGEKLNLERLIGEDAVTVPPAEPGPDAPAKRRRLPFLLSAATGIALVALIGIRRYLRSPGRSEKGRE